MNRNCLLNKLLAMLLCAVLLIGYLPVSALPAAAATDDKWESEKDVLETTTEAPTEPETTVPEVEETTVPEVEETTEPEVESEPVKYVIWSAADNKAMTALDSSKTFGYLPATDVTPDDYDAPVGYGIANIFTLIQNGENYYIVDSQGRYLYMTGTYNSYNVSATLPAEGAEWKLTDLGDGTYHITNVLKSKTVSYGSSYNTFGAYANEPFSAMTLYEIPGYTADNPVFLFDIEKTVVNDGTMYYATRHSATMVVSGEGAFSVVYGGETLTPVDGAVEVEVAAASMWEPASFTLNGTGEYTIKFVYPEGTENNPVQATLYYNYATIAEGGTEYYFNYTADYTGNLLVEIFSSDDNWQYTINNLTAYSYGETQWSDSDPVVNPATVAVTQGDVIEIKVITYDPADMWNIPAGDITVYLSYEPGTCEEFRYVLDKNVQTVTNAGTKYYLARHSGCRMVISGEGNFSINYNGEVISSEYGFISTEVYSANPFFNPVVFELTGDGDYTIEFIYPAGHANNPATAFLGDNIAEIEDNGGEYYFNYTAEQTGNLVVGISSNDGNWQYTVNNLTTLSYGDAQYSDSDPVVNPATVAVTQGDVIEIKVVTYNPETPWVVSAGKITVNLSYKQPAQPEVELKMAGATMSFESSLTLSISVKEEVYNYYTDMRMEFTTVDAETGVPTTVAVANAYRGLNSNNQVRWYFDFKGITPRKLNDDIDITLYGTYDGVEYSATKQDYSPTDYCYGRLEASNNAAFKTLLVNLLNYATKHQSYVYDYNIENPANGNLTPEQKALGTYGELTFGNPTNLKYRELQGATAKFKGANLFFQNVVQVFYRMQLPEGEINVNDYSLKLETADQSWTINGEDFVYDESNGTYCVYFEGLAARQMREAVITTIYCGNTAISNSVLYGVESYCNAKYATVAADLQELLLAMMHYGDACRAYAQQNN